MDGNRLSDRFGLVRAGSCSNLCRKVALLLLDAFAELEADEARQGNRGARILRPRRDYVGHWGLVVANKELAEKRVFLTELRKAAFDHFLDDVLRLAALARLFHRDGTLTLDERWID